MLSNHFQKIVLQSTNATGISSSEVLQSLWSGYGEIVRLSLVGGSVESVVLKYIVLPKVSSHPRGWNTDISHQRKIKSYDVEICWYRDWSEHCDSSCRVAKCYSAIAMNDKRLIILEDLDAAGYSLRYPSLDRNAVKLCLRWLANFHAKFLNVEPLGLWQTGTYWHLQTRPDEFDTMQSGEIKNKALAIDEALSNCRYQTLVHGDAKVANFCFAEDQKTVAAVDFQYVGAGCGMKDVAYFLGSCLDEKYCEIWQQEFLDYYFNNLRIALDKTDKKIDWQALESEWRFMFPVAWTDFYRFVLGWMPGHKKINAYADKLAEEALHQLGNAS